MAFKIVLHGATNWGSSNYGDYIYADMIYNYLLKKGFQVRCFQPSRYFLKNLKNYNKQENFKISTMDALVYLPGGYFGEGHNARLIDNLIHWIRFIPIGLWAAIKKKPIAILGIGAGPLHWVPLKFAVKYICMHASLITTRDEYSYNTLKTLCPFNQSIRKSFDLIVAEQNLINHADNSSLNHPVLLVHYNHSHEALKKFAYATKKFKKKHPEYKVVISSDQILENDRSLFDEFRSISQIANCSFHQYTTPEEMTDLISRSNLILTSKLHVGVVGAVMEKSVVSVPCHPEKTMRFYSEIGETGRCLELDTSSPDEICNIMEKYRLKGILINRRFAGLAEITWKLFDKFLMDLK